MMHINNTAHRAVGGAFSEALRTLKQVYIPHFFDRYRERYLKDPFIPKLDVLHQYMLSNGQGALAEIPSEKYPGSVWSRCDDGLVLCQQFIFYRFISESLNEET